LLHVVEQAGAGLIWRLDFGDALTRNLAIKLDSMKSKITYALVVFAVFTVAVLAQPWVLPPPPPPPTIPPSFSPIIGLTPIPLPSSAPIPSTPAPAVPAQTPAKVATPTPSPQAGR
jgi:hypothetical protein